MTQKLTVPDLAAKKAKGERLVMVAVGEVLTATWA
jgi:3-methyl-2-oxobutanoate hydroxymethyltransferase